MEKIKFRHLELQTTRKCNMNCDYCYCGKAQNVNMSREVVDRVLDQTASIDKLRLIGGEIACNIPIMEYILEGLIKRNIIVKGVGINTNATMYSQELIDIYNRFYDYAMYKDSGYSWMSISTDTHHQAQPEYKTILDNIPLYQANFHGQVSLNNDGDNTTILIGRAGENDFKENNKKIVEDQKDNAAILYNSAIQWEHGKVVNTIKINPYGYVYDFPCSYAIQDKDNGKNAIGNIFEDDFITMFDKHNLKPEIIAHKNIQDCLEKLSYCTLSTNEFYNILLPSYEVFKPVINQSETLIYFNWIEDFINPLIKLYEESKDCGLPKSEIPISKGVLLWHYVETLQEIFKNGKMENANKVPKLIDAFIIAYELLTPLEKDYVMQTPMSGIYNLFMSYKNLIISNKKEFGYLQEKELEVVLYCKVEKILNVENNKEYLEQTLQNFININEYRRQREEFCGFDELHDQYPNLTRKECISLTNSLKQYETYSIDPSDFGREIAGKHKKIIERLTQKGKRSLMNDIGDLFNSLLKRTN